MALEEIVHVAHSCWKWSQAKIIDNSHLQFSCNNRWDFQKCPCNSHPILTRQFSSNSHLQFVSNSHLQFSSNSHLTILIQFSPDNSHPIFTWQLIVIQFSPTILTQFSSTLLSQFSPTMLSQFSRNDQPICSHQSCCYFYSMLIL